MFLTVPDELKTWVNRAPDAALDAVARVYDDLGAAVARESFKCDASGACCRFEAHGHRLYVTTLELAHFARRVAAAPDAAWDGTGCPWQVGGLCAAREARPFGCRVYFCDRASDGWQEAQYESAQATLRQLHEAHGVPYAYVEWRAGLRALGLARETAKRLRVLT